MAAHVDETRQNDTRARWLATPAAHREDFDGPAGARCWPPAPETCNDGLDVMTVRVEHARRGRESPAQYAPQDGSKAKRVRDNRKQ